MKLSTKYQKLYTKNAAEKKKNKPATRSKSEKERRKNDTTTGPCLSVSAVGKGIRYTDDSKMLDVNDLRAKMPHVGDTLIMSPTIYLGQGETLSLDKQDAKVIYVNPDNLTYLVEFASKIREMHSMKETKAVLQYA